MERELFKQKLIKYGYKLGMRKSLACGRAKPSYEAMLVLYREHGIPFEAWEDIKSFLKPNNKATLKEMKKLTEFYLQEHNTKQSNTIATPQGQSNGTR